MVTTVRLGHLMLMATVGRMLHWHLPGPFTCKNFVYYYYFCLPVARVVHASEQKFS
jgi:hypothetical protein